jgi:hypothetical protein
LGVPDVNPSKQAFPGVEKAIEELGHPERLWLRGHTETHRLLPWLFRLPGGRESEQQIVERFLNRTSKDESTKDESKSPSLESIIEMHNRYFPTRLIDWTEDLHVALFCSLARELEAPTIFVLDPLKLNQLSGLNEIPSIQSLCQITRHVSDWPKVPKSPTAITSDISHPLDTLRLFTIHGKDTRPLEQQCPECVRKIVLTDEEKSAAVNYILSGENAKVTAYFGNVGAL